jgi:hypothetical protein
VTQAYLLFLPNRYTKQSAAATNTSSNPGDFFVVTGAGVAVTVGLAVVAVTVGLTIVAVIVGLAVVAVTVGVPVTTPVVVLVAVGVFVGVTLADGAVIALAINVTSVCASALPFSVAPVFIEISVLDRIIPLKSDVVPSVV